jgi:hypothetical protein
MPPVDGNEHSPFVLRKIGTAVSEPSARLGYERAFAAKQLSGPRLRSEARRACARAAQIEQINPPALDTSTPSLPDFRGARENQGLDCELPGHTPRAFSCSTNCVKVISTNAPSMPLPSPWSDQLSVAARLLGSSAGFLLAVILALCAAHWYVLPNFRGSSGGNIWLESDVSCSLGSSALALTVGLWSRRESTGAGAAAAGSLAVRVAIWLGFALFFFAVWVEYLFLFTLLIAPTHAFACLRLVGLWSRWRADVLWRRRG